MDLSIDETAKRHFWAESTYPSEDFKIDGKDDSSKPLNKIHASPEDFRRQMLELTRFCYRRTSSREWASQLRFLEICHSDLPNSQGRPWPDGGVQEVMVNLRHKREVALTTYVAVSYTWNRSGASWFHSQGHPKVSIATQDDRYTVVSTMDVVFRSLRFAHHYGCKYIWMDQFCIDQDDLVDKQEGIQAMDIVYQSSQHPVAVLESYIDSQSALDAFASPFTGTILEPDQLDDLLEVLQMLANDSWFTRAWTLQEAVSSGLTMNVLVGCGPHLEKPEEFCCNSLPIHGEIRTTLWDLQVAMVTIRNWMEEFLASNITEDNDLLCSISNYADIIYNLIPNILPASGDAWSNVRTRSSCDRQVCNGAEAVNALPERSNSVFSDRLGIIGNLCDFELRLHSDVLDPETPFGFSTCVHALAILNGDTSLLGRYSDPNHPSYLARDGQNAMGLLRDPTNDSTDSFGFSWGPTSWGALRNIEYFDVHDEPFKLFPSELSSLGLKVRGVLWSIDTSVELQEMQTIFCGRWEQELRTQAQDSFAAFFEEKTHVLAANFLSCLLHTLHVRRQHEITRTIWDFFQPRQDSTILSRKSHASYTFEEVFGPASRVCVEDIQHELRVQSLGIVDPSDRQPSIMRVMLDSVCKTGHLLFGRQLGGSKAPRVFFESCNPGDLVFTPYTDMGDKICTESVYRTQAVSWRVMPGACSESNHRILRCFGRRCGIYRMDDLDILEYYLE